MDDSELKAIVKNRKLKPSDLFEPGEILDDPVTKQKIQTEVDFEIYYQNKTLNEELQKGTEEDRKQKKQEENPFIP